VTLAGAAFAGVILLVGLAAFASANNLLFLLLAAMLAALSISGFVGRLSLAGLEIACVYPSTGLPDGISPAEAAPHGIAFKLKNAPTRTIHRP
jgi:hypothetical protein